MTRFIKSSATILAFAAVLGGCEKKSDYSLGPIAAPTNVTITAAVAGVDGTHPNGDGSGDVAFTLSGTGVLAYKIDYDASDGIVLDLLPTGKATKKYTTTGTNTYRVTVVAYGTGGAATTVTKDVTVLTIYNPPAALVTNLVGATNSKTWAVDKDANGHFGVGPWTGSSTPEWYAATPNEKAGCCNCFYTARFTFAKNTTTGAYSLTVASPDGAFTKTGGLAGGLPGIPASGAEGCYPYAGGTSSFAFVASGTAVPSSASTKVAMVLGGNNTYIGYGAQLKEYEILSITATTMYLRVQGTETGNAWYLKLKAI
ncbi:hypothetical protein GWC95_10840 [Sediminibacterium roseum]|uniref:Cadherin domain-containing protein n=1 Tax=Sediminibacterium roseum TaxID=1978412 RepID=A0ABW9ZZK4_9BACT|nr:hypothetical protein [Sediminibacterium roseum]NCI50420.1 hypothetical protein [Sediminibacterium roseum]